MFKRVYFWSDKQKARRRWWCEDGRISRSDHQNHVHAEFSRSHDGLETQSRPWWKHFFVLEDRWSLLSLMVPPPSLGGCGLFVPESFEERQHPLPHVAAAAIALGYPRHHYGATAAAVVTGWKRREGGAVHGVGPFDLWWVNTPWLRPRWRSLSHETLLILDLTERNGLSEEVNSSVWGACRVWTTKGQKNNNPSIFYFKPPEIHINVINVMSIELLMGFFMGNGGELCNG